MRIREFLLLFMGIPLLIGILIPLSLKAEQTVHEPSMFKTVAVTSEDHSYVTYPEFSNMMPVTVTTSSDNTEDGLVFLTNVGFRTNFDSGFSIVDDSGETIYLQKGISGKYVTDFKVQNVDGKPYLVYHEGTPFLGWTNGKYYVLDNTYSIVDVWEMKNGHYSDLHEIQLLDNGNALMLAYTSVPMDLSLYGGPAEGTVMEIVIQELSGEKEVVFEWHSLDHIPVTDTFSSLMNSPLDYMHSNAIEVDDDGNLLVSNRNTSDIIKIDRVTGDVIWRLGGKQNEFDFTNDDGFSYQHDIRRLENGNISLFDNGVQKNPKYSRVVEYTIDEDAKTITRVWQFPNDKNIYASIMGNGQRLANGNTLIGWGGVPKISEVTSSGQIAWSLELGGLTYRAFRSEWEAIPGALPRMAIVYSDTTSAIAYSSWNGATQITDYEIYAGATVDSMSLIMATQKTGFETAVSLTNLDPNICVLKNRPVHTNADPMPYSSLIYRLDQPKCIELLTNKLYLPLISQE